MCSILTIYPTAVWQKSALCASSADGDAGDSEPVVIAETLHREVYGVGV